MQNARALKICLALHKRIFIHFHTWFFIYVLIHFLNIYTAQSKQTDEYYIIYIYMYTSIRVGVSKMQIFLILWNVNIATKKSSRETLDLFVHREWKNKKKKSPSPNEKTDPTVYYHLLTGCIKDPQMLDISYTRW